MIIRHLGVGVYHHRERHRRGEGASLPSNGVRIEIGLQAQLADSAHGP